MFKQVSNTRIYLACDKLFNAILDITPNFPRNYKFTVGGKMQELCIQMQIEISAAYLNKDKNAKLRHLTDFQAYFEVLKMLIRTAGDRKWIQGKNRHADIVDLLDGISRQSGTWKKSIEEGDDE